MKYTVACLLVSFLSVSVLTAGCNINRNDPVFKQCDAQWGSDKLGSSSTVCSTGCIITSLASALAGLGLTVNNQTVNPKVLNNYLLSNSGYSGNLFNWASVSRFGLKYRGQFNSKEVLKDAICSNKVVILSVNNAAHWVLATAFEDDTFYVNDSGYSRESYYASKVVVGAIYD